MKKLALIAASIITLAAFAQDPISSGNFIGANLGQPSPQYSPAQVAAQESAEAKLLLDGHHYRRIAGAVHDLQKEGATMSGIFFYLEPDGVMIINQGANRYLGLKNYKGSPPATGDTFRFRALSAGTYQWKTVVVNLYDCGEVLVPGEENKLQDEEDKQLLDEQLAAQKQAQAKTEARLNAARLQRFLAESNAVMAIKSEAASGSASAQYALGQHYLKGLGCETNAALAIHWFKVAAANGDENASNKLASITIK